MSSAFRIVLILACLTLLLPYAVQGQTLNVSTDLVYAGPYTDIVGATTITATGAITGGSLVTGGTLSVAGNTSLSTVTTSGLATLDSLSVVNNATVGGTLGVTGATTLTGALTANGGATINNGAALFSGTGAATDNRMIVNATGASIGSQFSGLSVTSATNVVSLVSDNDASAANARASLSMSPTSAALLVNTNGGISHGLTINQSSTVLSGGTNSTTLTLDDNGATFENTETGGPAKVTGVADGSSSFDAVNFGQLESSKRELSGGIASIAALAAIPGPVPCKNYSAGLGFGNYNGESAVAIGVKAYLPESFVSLGAGVGLASSSSPSFNFGASYSF